MIDDEKARIAWRKYVEAIEWFNQESTPFFANLATGHWEDFCNLTMTENEASRHIYSKTMYLTAAMRINKPKTPVRGD